MKIVKMNCPNCNGKLEINSNDKTTVCNYCGTTLAILLNLVNMIKH